MILVQRTTRIFPVASCSYLLLLLMPNLENLHFAVGSRLGYLIPRLFSNYLILWSFRGNSVVNGIVPFTQTKKG